MEKLNGFRNKFAGGEPLRWAMIALAVAAAVTLAATLELGSAHAETLGFKFRQALVRIITPNGDRKNDLAILCYENANDFDVTAKIFDLRGQVVADMRRLNAASGNAILNSCPVATISPARMEALTWDGHSNGVTAASGVYIYRIQCESRAVTGTILVVR